MNHKTSEPSSHKSEALEDSGSSAEDTLGEIRKLLLEPEQARLGEVEKRLDDHKIRANDVSQVLPEAILLRSSRDKLITEALESTIAETIKTTIRRDRKALAEAIFPIIGPAIRKAISSTIRGMIQSLNRTLEHSFSIRALKWRLEALRTNKSFGEVVLINTLIYQVEQILLIHKNTGLMLQHVVAAEVVSQDPDLVSSMLTAIQDFAQDSFHIEEGQSLDAIRIGGRNVWVEDGPHAVLAVVIQGNPPESLKSVLAETIESIHLIQGNSLESFDGDTAPFETVRNQLEDCLQSQYRQEKRKTSPLLWGILAALIILVGIWGTYRFRDHQRWERYLKSLNSTPGIWGVKAETRSGRRHISGLRDPLAHDPLEMLQETKLDADKAIFNWEPYQSLHPQIALERLEGILKPPETVTLELKDGIFYGYGAASHKWIFEAKRAIKFMPGIAQYQDDDIVDIEQQAIEVVIQKVNGHSLLFQSGKSKVKSKQEYSIRELVANIGEIVRLSKILEKNVEIEIVGHSDSSGAENANMELSWERANRAFSILVSNGLNEDIFTMTGVGSEQPLKEEITEQDREFNRCVTFRIALADIHD